MTLETITASLANGYKQLKPDTFQTSAELTTERRTNTELRDRWLYTANFAMYIVENGEAVLYFGGREANPILKNIDEACAQLLAANTYRVKEEDRQAVIESVESKHTLRIELSKLFLIKLNNETAYFEIDTSNYNQLNTAQRAFAERVYGAGNDFVQNMDMLKKAGKTRVRVYVLNHDYVKEHVLGGEAVARACWLDNFGNYSDFSAFGWSVNYDRGLRGVLKVD